MTPSITFQCPLSPAGTFQPERSLPLKSGANPSCSSLTTAKSVIPCTSVSQAADMSIQPLRYIEKPPTGEMRNDRPPKVQNTQRGPEDGGFLADVFSWSRPRWRYQLLDLSDCLVLRG